ncbi:hypothetical protein ACOSQ4_006755 [Xanthoceras sorbifolium]
MEELREATIAYYNNSSNDLQMVAWNLFQSLDLDRDGKKCVLPPVPNYVERTAFYMRNMLRSSRDDAYDLCPTCYPGRLFSHRHNYFLDSYALLRSKRGTSSGATNLNLAQTSIPQPLVVAAPANHPARLIILLVNLLFLLVDFD